MLLVFSYGRGATTDHHVGYVDVGQRSQTLPIRRQQPGRRGHAGAGPRRRLSPVARIDRRELAAIFGGGAAGAVLRVWLGTELSAGGGAPSWPWVTFVINLTGCAALAYFATRLQERLPLSTYRRPLLGTGFCGAYTTFSTMQIELLTMIDHGRYGLAVAYALTSLAGGYGAIWTATGLVRRSRMIA